jgi:hypothetical protein
LLRGAIVGGAIGVGLAALYLVLGARGNDLTQILAYSLVLIGFPAVFAVSSVVNWLGVQGGLSEYIGLVLLTLPLNGTLWGAILGATIRKLAPSSEAEGPNNDITSGAA